jgi:hypothetical protein
MRTRFFEVMIRCLIWLTGFFWLSVVTRIAVAFSRQGVAGVENELLHLGSTLYIDEASGCDRQCSINLVFRALGGWAILSLVVAGIDRWRAKTRREHKSI